MSGELTVAVPQIARICNHNGLRKSAKKLVEKTDDAAELEKQLDDLVEKKQIARKEADDLIEELEKVAEEKVRSLNIGDDVGEIVDLTRISKIVERIRNTTKLKNFDILVVDRNNKELAELYKAWQKKPAVEGVFFSKTGYYKKFGVNVKGPRIYLFTGNTSEGFLYVKGHTLQHEIFHVEMHAKLIEQLGFEKYQKLIDKIPTHIKEEYVVHRFLRTKSKAMNGNEIEKEIFRINKDYRPFGFKNLTVEYLEKEWNLKNELKKINIHY